MMPEGQKMVCVTDSNWDAYCEYQAYDHQAMDRSNDYMLEKVRKDMANYKTGPDGFSVQAFARYGNDPTTLYAADTLEELADIMGYEGDAKQGFWTRSSTGTRCAMPVTTPTGAQTHP